MIREISILGTTLATAEDGALGQWAMELRSNAVATSINSDEYVLEETEIEDEEPAGKRTRYYMRTVYLRRE